MDMEKPESERISGMDALLFAIALEVVLLQMRVHEGSTKLRLSSNALDQRGRTQYDKLVRDREMVKDVIRQTLIEVAESGEWNTLQQAVRVLQDKISYITDKKKEHEKLILKLDETSNELTTKRNEWVVKLFDADQKTAFLRDKMKDDQLNANIRLRYAELWLSARMEALELRFQTERKPVKIPSPEHEQRIHDEICKAIELQIQECKKGIEHWSARYAEDTVSMNQLLVEKRQQLAIATTKREDLQKLYDLHEGEMRAWLSFKEQRAARLAREQRIRNAATHIQSWWRGMLVRKALGPFKFLRNIKKSTSKSKKK